MAAPLSPDPAPLTPLKWAGHRYEAIEIENEAEKDHTSSPVSDSDSTCHSPSNETSASSIQNADLPWRPFYLRRRVLLFAAVFAIILMAIEGLVATSEKNNGIVSASSNLHYLWTYGPTALLTLVAAIWSRTEYQSKLVAPWIRLSQQASHPKHTVLLDYLSDFQLYAVFKALRNRDFLVSIASAVAIIIKVMIVISTGLISLSWTLVDHAWFPMTVQDRFVDNGARLGNSGNLAYYIMQGLIDRNLTYPDGMSETYAFQSVQADLPDTAETRVVVDGFESSLDCRPADVVLRGSMPGDPHYYAESTLNLTITSPDCNVQDLKIYPGPGGNCFRDDPDRCTLLFGRFHPIQCDGTAGDSGRRVLVMYGNMTYVVDRSRVEEDYTGQLRRHPTLATLNRSTQMLCVPTYAITEVEVVRNGTHTRSVTRSPGARNRTLDSVTGWHMMDAHYAAFAGIGSTDDAYPRSVNISGTVVDVDAYLKIALPSQFDTDEQLPTLLEPEPLRGMATRYYRQFAAIIAKQALVEPASVETHGSVVLFGNRLVMRTWAAQWMAGLAICCFLLATIGAFLVPRGGILPHSPTTLPGMASLVAESHDLLASLRYSGAANAQSLASPLAALRFKSGTVPDPASNKPRFAILSAHELLDRSSTVFPQISSKHMHPGVLHPVSRCALCLVLAGLIISLELTLRKSNKEDGLGDVGDDTYIHYAWTALPAFVFGVLAMTISSMDFQVRSLAPYTALKHTINAKTFMTIDFMDMSIPRTMFNEIKFVNIGALAATTAFLVSSVFAIVSSSLFQPVAIPTVLPATLHANMSFKLYPYGNKEAASIASLIFESNLSYPRFTYGDLAFPPLVPSVSLTPDHIVNTSSISINAEIPAVRAKLTCRLYNASKIQTNLTLNYTAEYSSYQNPLGIYIEGEECNRFPEYETGKYNNILSTYPNVTFFGLGDETSNMSAVQGCSDLLYTWGKLDFTATPIVQHIAAVGCNQTAETVMVNTTFVGTALDIDSRNLPQPLENTARPSSLRPSASLIYAYLASLNTAPQILDPFIQMLTSSPWAIPLSSLGDPAALQNITDAIKYHHGIIAAQTFAQQLVPANSSNATLPISMLEANPNATDDGITYTGTATAEDGSGKRRVVQDTTSTRILQALLATTIALVAVGWACMHETDVLPRRPTTIASVVALLAGGNLFEGPLGGGADGKGGDHKGGGWIWDRVGTSTSSKGGGGEKENTGLVDARLERAKFWMGWGTVPDWEGREAGGGENEGGVSRFGIFVLWDEDEDEGGKEKDGEGGLMGGG
jgi:hypothetical protein